MNWSAGWATELTAEVRAAQLLRARLKEEFADDPELAASMIEGETGIHEAIEAAAKAVFEDEGRIEAIHAMIGKLQTRKSRIENRVEIMRAAICVAMLEAAIKTKDYGFCTVTVKPLPPAAIIADEAAVPSEYWRPQEPRLDRRAVLTALKQGAVPGAELSNGGETIAIKWS